MSKNDWMTVAEAAAADQYGRKYAKAFAFRRFGMVPTAIIVGVGFLGWLAYRGWLLVAGLFDGGMPATSGVPVSLVAVAGVLLVLTVAAYRPGRMPSSPVTLLVKAVVFTAAWLMLIAFAVGSTT